MGTTDDRASVVIAGGGVAALEVALALREQLQDRIALTVVSASPSFRFRTLDVGVPFGLGAPHEHDLAALLRRLDVGFVHDGLAGVDAAQHEISLASGGRLPYDRLVVAVGAPTQPPTPFGIVFERGGDGRFEETLADLRAGLISHVAFVVQASVTWPLPVYELALMTAAWGAETRPGGVRVTVATHEPAPLALFGTEAAKSVADRLEQAGVTFAGGHDPVPISDTVIRTGAHQLVAERLVVFPEPAGPGIEGLPQRRGFVPVDPWGRVPVAPGVVAIGDAADHPVKQGGLAAQQAAVAASAIAADILGTPAPPVPDAVLRGLLRTVDGPLYLRAVLGDEEATSAASAEPLWWPPAKLVAPRLTALIDRIERELGQGIVLPAGHHGRSGLAAIAAL